MVKNKRVIPVWKKAYTELLAYQMGIVRYVRQSFPMAEVRVNIDPTFLSVIIVDKSKTSISMVKIFTEMLAEKYLTTNVYVRDPYWQSCLAPLKIWVYFKTDTELYEEVYKNPIQRSC